MADDARRLYGVQFHPEVTHTEEGARVLENFLFGICGCKGDWSMDAYADMAVEQIREQVGDGTVLLGLSGGVDSAVAAALLYRAIGNRLTCVYVVTASCGPERAIRWWMYSPACSRWSWCMWTRPNVSSAISRA